MTNTHLCRLASVCLGLLIIRPVSALPEQVNLTLAQSGGMPTALASVANLNFSAQKACDGKPRTGWVSGEDALPVWLRVEWRVPVEIQEVVLRHFPKCPFREAGPMGEYSIEILRAGQWSRVAEGDASHASLSDFDPF